MRTLIHFAAGLLLVAGVAVGQTPEDQKRFEEAQKRLAERVKASETKAATPPTTNPKSGKAVPPDLVQKLSAAWQVVGRPVGDPPPELTSFQAKQWAEKQQKSREAVQKSLTAGIYSLSLTIGDVVPIEDVTQFPERDGMGLPAKTAATGTVKLSETDIADVVLIAADDRYAKANRGDNVNVLVEVPYVHIPENGFPPRLKVIAVVVEDLPGIDAAVSGRVVFLLDCTGTMIDGFAEGTARLKKLIEAMPPSASFVVLGSTDGGRLSSYRGTYLAATPENLKGMPEFINTLTPTGTDGGYAQALATISTLRPDSVWFVTDGEYNDPDAVVAAFGGAIRRTGSRFNVLLVGSVDPEGSGKMRKLTEATKGLCIDRHGRDWKE